ncbi:MAG: DUF1552 domain-containing protein [Planctomycetota bacterium]
MSVDRKRRRFLRGTGGAILALPLLEANAGDALATPPKRLVAASTFYGLMPHLFHPNETGRDYETPRLLKPLEHLRDGYTVFSGLDHNLGGGHDSTKYFLSGIPVTQARGLDEANISVDQKAALHVGEGRGMPHSRLGARANLKTTFLGPATGLRCGPSRVSRLSTRCCFVV